MVSSKQDVVLELQSIRQSRTQIFSGQANVGFPPPGTRLPRHTGRVVPVNHQNQVGPIMRVVAIETTGYSGSVALALADQVLIEANLPPQRGSAGTLVPALHDLFGQLGWAPQSVEMVAVVQGPGSFTGLRVGIATAKTLAFVAQARLCAINVHSVLSLQVGDPTHRARRDEAGGQVSKPEETQAAPEVHLHTVLDAFRGEVFCQAHAWRQPHGWSRLPGPHRQTIESWQAQVVSDCEQDQTRCLISGPIAEKFATSLPRQVELASADAWFPRAGTVALAAWSMAQHGEFADPFQLLPDYGRLSAAEDKWNARQTLAP